MWGVAVPSLDSWYARRVGRGATGQGAKRGCSRSERGCADLARPEVMMRRSGRDRLWFLREKCGKSEGRPDHMNEWQDAACGPWKFSRACTDLCPGVERAHE